MHLNMGLQSAVKARIGDYSQQLKNCVDVPTARDDEED